MALVQQFYGFLAAGSPVAVAARRAQDAVRCSGASSRIWSAMQVIGDGYAGEDQFDPPGSGDAVGGDP